MPGTYVHPADPSRDDDPKLALYHAEAARDQHQAGQLHDRDACGIPHREQASTTGQAAYHEALAQLAADDAARLGLQATPGPAQAVTDALAGVEHAQGNPGRFGLGLAHELAALRDLADAVRAALRDSVAYWLTQVSETRAELLRVQGDYAGEGDVSSERDAYLGALENLADAVRAERATGPRAHVPPF